jgi:hypothetical protein
MDSEFVLKCFGNSAIAIIVDTPGNKLELTYAYHYCKENNIEPVVIKTTEKDMITTYYENIFKKFNGNGIDLTAAIFSGKYALKNDGVLVVGDHLYDGLNEWDFYNDVLIGENYNLQFFLWTPEIAKAMKNEWEKFKILNDIKDIDLLDKHANCHQEFKYNLYNIPFRPKLKYNYSLEYQQIINKLLSSRSSRPRSEISINI